VLLIFYKFAENNINFMNLELKEENGFRFLETETQGETLLLLHGLFGALSNFQGLLGHFGKRYNVVVPILPIYDLPLFEVSVSGLVKHLERFVEYKGYTAIHMMGNSLGGHIAQLYVLAHPEKIQTMVLTGSSGLFESAFGNAFPKRGDYEYIRQKTADTFYDPSVASKELVDEVFEIVNDRNKAIRVVAMAKSAVRHNLGDKLTGITVPALLIWGRQDNVTPPFVAEKFKEMLVNSELYFIDKCGHAPMMECPDQFNAILENFLSEHRAAGNVGANN
jgi:pimeloyl-ACP methyl ester carboxylesterase